MTPPYISAVCACYAHERSFVAFGSANGAVGWLEVVMGWAGKKRVFVIKRHPTWLDTKSLKNSMVTFLGHTGTTLLVGAARQGMYYFDWSDGRSPHVTRLDPLPDVNDCVVAHDKLLIGTTDGIKISTFALQSSE
ncbi:MAG: uncharacterized protein KVP18_003191 [Porospora cf. gigantea A]|nr:MAG: hypothetical protein KVP18_003191 [Porospora cf. gigantea A]